MLLALYCLSEIFMMVLKCSQLAPTPPFSETPIPQTQQVHYDSFPWILKSNPCTVLHVMKIFYMYLNDETATI